MDNPQMNWMPYVISSPQIKLEASEANRPLISPPSTPLHPPPPPPFAATSSSRRRSSTSSLTGHKRPRPYPSVAPEYLYSPNRRARSDNSMSNNEFNWNMRSSGSGRTSAGRRSDEGEHTPPYSMPQYNMSDYLSMEGHNAPALTPPSSSSSLSGAVGGEGSRGSRSPPSNTVYGAHATMPSQQDMTWANQQMPSNVNMVSMNNTYPAVGGGFSPDVNGLYEYTTRHTSPSSDTIPSQSPQAYPQPYDAYGLARNMNIQHRQSGYNATNPMSTPFPQASEMSMAPVESSSAEVEIRRLRRRIQELQLENRRAREALDSLRNTASHSSGLPTPPHSSSFQSGWKARTEARKKLFCSLNRAGNALCAWHDSRRERRAYPPRNAPPGYLNCGCSYEEALFEESLSRHGVGSYHPGETVRMDPALRNPLLALLQKRYGYKDGDFEHDPLTEEWHDGESPALWEQKILTGQAVRRRPDSHSHERR